MQTACFSKVNWKTSFITSLNILLPSSNLSFIISWFINSYWSQCHALNYLKEIQLIKHPKIPIIKNVDKSVNAATTSESVLTKAYLTLSNSLLMHICSWVVYLRYLRQRSPKHTTSSSSITEYYQNVISRTHIWMIISWKTFAKVEPCHEINSVIVIEITRRRNPWKIRGNLNLVKMYSMNTNVDWTKSLVK